MQWFLSLNTDNQIAIISSIATLLISLVSLWIALKAIKITKASMLEANRPYVVVFLETVDIGYYGKYLVIKNFGKSGASISSITCNQTFENSYINNFLNDCSNRYIAPGQSFVTVFESEAGKEQMNFELKYSDGISNYQESIQLDSSMFRHQMHKTVSKSKLSDFENSLIQVTHAFKKSNF